MKSAGLLGTEFMFLFVELVTSLAKSGVKVGENVSGKNFLIQCLESAKKFYSKSQVEYVYGEYDWKYISSKSRPIVLQR